MVDTYVNPFHNLTEREIENLMTCEDKGLPVGDLNSRNVECAHIATNQKERVLARAVGADDCDLIAPDEPTHYHDGAESILNVIQVRHLNVLDIWILTDMDTNQRLVDGLRRILNGVLQSSKISPTLCST